MILERRTIHDDDIGMVVDVGIDFGRRVSFFGANFKGFFASGLRRIRFFCGGVREGFK